MATIRFNHIDEFSESLAKAIESEKATHRQFKALYTESGNKLISFQNSIAAEAKEISEKFECKLQSGCMSPAGAGWKFDSKGNIIGEKPDKVVVNFVFHGENCIQAASALNDFFINYEN